MLPFLNRPATCRPATIQLWHGLTLLLLLLLAGNTAHAVPAFARQTGYVCAVCHSSSYGGGDNGPALTPTGMRFKLNGYTDANIKGALPVAVQVIEAHTNPARGDSRTDFGSSARRHGGLRTGIWGWGLGIGRDQLSSCIRASS